MAASRSFASIAEHATVFFSCPYAAVGGVGLVVAQRPWHVGGVEAESIAPLTTFVKLRPVKIAGLPIVAVQELGCCIFRNRGGWGVVAVV